MNHFERGSWPRISSGKRQISRTPFQDTRYHLVTKLHDWINEIHLDLSLGEDKMWQDITKVEKRTIKYGVE